MSLDGDVSSFCRAVNMGSIALDDKLVAAGEETTTTTTTATATPSSNQKGSTRLTRALHGRSLSNSQSWAGPAQKAASVETTHPKKKVDHVVGKKRFLSSSIIDFLNRQWPR